MAQQNEQFGPLSPEREVIHESDINGIVALLQLSAGKRESSQKLGDGVGSPTQLGSPAKRARGYSPGVSPLSPSSRLMHMPTMHAVPTMPTMPTMLTLDTLSPPQVGLQSIQGLQVPGVSSISSMVHLHGFLPEWAKQEQTRVNRATAPLPDAAVTMASLRSRRIQESHPRVVSKRALQREARRKARRHAIYSSKIMDGLQSETVARAIGRDGLDGPPAARGANESDGGHMEQGRVGVLVEGGAARGSADGGAVGRIAPMEQPGTAGMSARTEETPGMDLKNDDEHGTLLAFMGREFFYSDQDEAWYGEGRAWMNGVLHDLGFDTTVDVMLTKAEWAALQFFMRGHGGLRRLSSRFMEDSRSELRLCRERGEAGHVYAVGQAITAVHPQTLEIQDGTVQGSVKHLCRVSFDRADLGVHPIPTKELRKAIQTRSTGALPPPAGLRGPGMQQAPIMHAPGTQSLPSSMPHLQGTEGVPLSHMLAAFIQSTGMQTPETSPEKLPMYGLPGLQHQMSGKSPSQLLEDAYRSKLEEDAKKALESVFDGEALKNMDLSLRRRFVLSEMNKALRSACSQENQVTIDRSVSYMYADCADEIDDIKDGHGMLGGTIRPLLDFGLCPEFEAGWRGHQRIRHELENHIKELLAMLMMLERVPGMFNVFLRGLDLLT